MQKMFKFDQQTIKSKLTMAFSILVAILVAMTALSIASLSKSQGSFNSFVTEEFSRGSLARDIRAAASARAISARNLILLTSAEDIQAETVAVKGAHDRVQERLAALRKAVDSAQSVSAAERDLLERMIELESKYGPVALDIVAKALAGQKEQAIEKMNAECQPLLKALIANTADYSNLIAQGGMAKIEASAGEFELERSLLMGASVVSMAIAVLMGFAIHRSLMRSLGADPVSLSAAARQVASGNLSPLKAPGAVPATSVLACLQDMQSALAGIVSQVRSTATSLEAGSKEIATGNSDLSVRTEQQATSLQQNASSMEQMTATVRQNAETAQEASRLALSARKAAENGGAVVRQVVSTMDEISDSSSRIADITSVIDGIAFQTNILALNASVEAARAGDQGRGFAVVAGEVRNLAQRSALAAKEIKALIDASVTKVVVGSSLVNDAGSAMTAIVDEVKRVADLIAEISRATQEQANGINHVSSSVARLDESTQQNAALVEQMASAAGVLNQQAQGLVHSVAVFRLVQKTI
ncbi:methyl-accepting chemotaxis protein [Roseateles sp. DC23W]|uniref:Methyl-accepting chemotaxis protein n=1 Tax=Pelomonas dachongensis TaxID=3299029 RepID=A0ABW7EMS5_9BURK